MSDLPKNIKYEDNEANIPDWVLEESARALRKTPAAREKDIFAKEHKAGFHYDPETEEAAYKEAAYKDAVARFVAQQKAKQAARSKDDNTAMIEGSENEANAMRPGDKQQGYKKGGRIKKMADGGVATGAFGTDPTGANSAAPAAPAAPATTAPAVPAFGSPINNKKTGGKIKAFAKGGWIKKAIKKPGALRESLGVKKGEKIPAKKLAAAAKKPGKTGQRARLAQTLKGFKEGGSIRGGGCESRGKTRGKIV